MGFLIAYCLFMVIVGVLVWLSDRASRRKDIKGSWLLLITDFGLLLVAWLAVLPVVF